jgi:DNA-directed RNA polymerase specialized sigma24 family protein
MDAALDFLTGAAEQEAQANGPTVIDLQIRGLLLAEHQRDHVARKQRREGPDDAQLTERQYLDRTLHAVRVALPRLSEQEQEDVASEVRASVARRHGWLPMSGDVRMPFLTSRAVSVWKDKRRQIADVECDSSLDAPTVDADSENDETPAGSFLADSAGLHVGAGDAEWRKVADALACPTGSADADAVMCALAGYKSGVELATLRGMTTQGAYNRLDRGRKRLRERYPDAQELVNALALADAADEPLTAGPVLADGRINPFTGEPMNATPVYDERVRLLPGHAYARTVLDTLGMTTAGAPVRVDIDPIRAEQRERQERKLRAEQERVRTMARSTPGSTPAVLRYLDAVERYMVRVAAACPVVE